MARSFSAAVRASVASCAMIRMQELKRPPGAGLGAPVSRAGIGAARLWLRVGRPAKGDWEARSYIVGVVRSAGPGTGWHCA